MPKLPASVSVHTCRDPRTLSPNAEDCLERIAELISAKGYARVSDIATALRITSPSVTAMVQHLAQRGFLLYERYRGLTLTPKGAATAKQQMRRRAVLVEFFTLLGLDAVTVARDVEGMEHHLSDAALARLEMVVVAWRPSVMASNSPQKFSSFGEDDSGTLRQRDYARGPFSTRQ